MYVIIMMTSCRSLVLIFATHRHHRSAYETHVICDTHLFIFTSHGVVCVHMDRRGTRVERWFITWMDLALCEVDEATHGVVLHSRQPKVVPRVIRTADDATAQHTYATVTRLLAEHVPDGVLSVQQQQVLQRQAVRDERMAVAASMGLL